jgi:serine protease
MAVVTIDDPRWPNQGYLDPAPDGVDAEFAWTIGGGDGAGPRVIDLEGGWTLAHEDLMAQGASLLFGSIVNSSRSHGTAVLGEIRAVDNTLGCVGITPNIASVDVVSHSGSFSNVSDAIPAAIAAMDFGHVLLLEMQTVTAVAPVFGAPIELIDDIFETIRLATALGIVVVETGGNGSNNLDTLTNFAGNYVLNPASPDFRDSGAIIAGAASSANPHTRMDFSSFGARVDCYAWGENVDTTSSASVA